MRVFSLAVVLGLLASSSGMAVAQDTAPAPLAVDRVIVSTAGLAHIEHVLDVTGTQRVTLPLRLAQVDDVLKSLVIFDARGSLGAVTLPGRQPLAEAFRDLPFRADALNDPILLLNAYQGAGVTVTQGGAAQAGTLVSVTPEVVVHDTGISETRYRLTLMTAQGLKRLWLDDAQSLQFDDATIKNEISRALAAVRTNATSDIRALDVTLKGEGKRAVRLGYVIEAPVWKAAYRMVLPAEGSKQGQGLLQGWAVVENMTASDWTNVDLTLVSGNPVTFRQNLYQSYHVERPEVPVEVLGRVLPRVDGGVVGTADVVEQVARNRAAVPMMAKAQRAAPAPAAMPQMMEMQESMALAADAAVGYGGFAGGSDSVAQGALATSSAEATTQVLFHFDDRVTLPAGQSLLVPFTSGQPALKRLSLFQPDTHARHPMAAVEITNAAATGLPPGVLTLYEDSAAHKGTAYVGDARLPAVAAGEKRLVAYALDSKVTVDRATTSDTVAGKVTIAGGVIKAARTLREKTTYTVKAPAQEARTVVIEHPRRGDFTLVEPKDNAGVEVTDGYYRLTVALDAGETTTVPIVLERVLWQNYAVETFTLDDLLSYAATRGEMDKDTRKLFAALADMRRSVDTLDGKINRLTQERETIFNDQTRVRDNLRSLGSGSDVQQRYLKKLDEQETRLGEIDAELGKLHAARDAALADMKKKIAAVQDTE